MVNELQASNSSPLCMKEGQGQVRSIRAMRSKIVKRLLTKFPSHFKRGSVPFFLCEFAGAYVRVVRGVAEGQNRELVLFTAHELTKGLVGRLIASVYPVITHSEEHEGMMANLLHALYRHIQEGEVLYIDMQDASPDEVVFLMLSALDQVSFVREALSFAVGVKPEMLSALSALGVIFHDGCLSGSGHGRHLRWHQDVVGVKRQLRVELAWFETLREVVAQGRSLGLNRFGRNSWSESIRSLIVFKPVYLLDEDVPLVRRLVLDMGEMISRGYFQAQSFNVHLIYRFLVEETQEDGRYEAYIQAYAKGWVNLSFLDQLKVHVLLSCYLPLLSQMPDDMFEREDLKEAVRGVVRSYLAKADLSVMLRAILEVWPLDKVVDLLVPVLLEDVLADRVQGLERVQMIVAQFKSVGGVLRTGLCERLLEEQRYHELYCLDKSHLLRHDRANEVEFWNEIDLGNDGRGQLYAFQQIKRLFLLQQDRCVDLYLMSFRNPNVCSHMKQWLGIREHRNYLHRIEFAIVQFALGIRNPSEERQALAQEYLLQHFSKLYRRYIEFFRQDDVCRRVLDFLLLHPVGLISYPSITKDLGRYFLEYLLIQEDCSSEQVFKYEALIQQVERLAYRRPIYQIEVGDVDAILASAEQGLSLFFSYVSLFEVALLKAELKRRIKQVLGLSKYHFFGVGYKVKLSVTQSDLYCAKVMYDLLKRLDVAYDESGKVRMHIEQVCQEVGEVAV